MTPTAADDASVGLCAACAHARVQHGKRGSTFWRCARADSDPRFRRYPPLPVRTCSGHEPGQPTRATGDERAR